MNSLSPFIYVKDVTETIEYYKSVLGGEIKKLNENQKKLLHADLIVGNNLIHVADTFGMFPVSDKTHIIIDCDSEKEIRHIYNTFLHDGGEAVVELEYTFFGALHAQVKDHLNGITWVLNYFTGEKK